MAINIMEKIYKTSTRKGLILLLYRKLLMKISIYRKFDYFIYDYYKLIIKNEFKISKRETKLNSIKLKIKKGERFLYKLNSINVFYSS